MLMDHVSQLRCQVVRVRRLIQILVTMNHGRRGRFLSEEREVHESSIQIKLEAF